MKKSTFGMMLIGMMMLGTTTSFGKGHNPEPRNNNNGPRMEQRNDKDSRNIHGDRRSDRDYHMRPVEHRGDRHMPEPRPVHHTRHHHNGSSDVVTGVVIGTVIGGILSTLVR